MGMPTPRISARPCMLIILPLNALTQLLVKFGPTGDFFGVKLPVFAFLQEKRFRLSGSHENELDRVGGRWNSGGTTALVVSWRLRKPGGLQHAD